MPNAVKGEGKGCSQKTIQYRAAEEKFEPIGNEAGEQSSY